VIEAGYPMNFRTMFEAIDVFPLSRGLRIELDWSNGAAAQALIDNIVGLLVEEQATYYPTLEQVGTLRLIDKTNAPERPPTALAALDIVLKSGVALILSVALALIADWRMNRIHEEDLQDLTSAPVIGRLP
jgi:capsular polysaccharide biosynthesis protein